MSAAKADNYPFRAVTLKEKRLEHDVEGIPMLKSEKEPIFLEFQSYWDPFIPYRLVASVFQGCTQQKYKEQVIAGIIYTEKEYQTAALPLSKIMGTDECQDWFKEIVLTDYTETEWLNTDPKRIVLAQFTWPTETEKASVLEKAHEWVHKVGHVFHHAQQQNTVYILGLFALNRFSVADFVSSTLIGRGDGIEDAREMVLEALNDRFGIVPGDMIQQVRAIAGAFETTS